METTPTFTAVLDGSIIKVVPATFGSFESPAGGWIADAFASAVARKGFEAEVKKASARWTPVASLTGHAVNGVAVSAAAFDAALGAAATA